MLESRYLDVKSQFLMVNIKETKQRLNPKCGWLSIHFSGRQAHQIPIFEARRHSTCDRPKTTKDLPLGLVVSQREAMLWERVKCVLYKKNKGRETPTPKHNLLYNIYI